MVYLITVKFQNVFVENPIEIIEQGNYLNLEMLEMIDHMHLIRSVTCMGVLCELRTVKPTMSLK